MNSSTEHLFRHVGFCELLVYGIVKCCIIGEKKKNYNKAHFHRACQITRSIPDRGGYRRVAKYLQESIGLFQKQNVPPMLRIFEIDPPPGFPVNFIINPLENLFAFTHVFPSNFHIPPWNSIDILKYARISKSTTQQYRGERISFIKGNIVFTRKLYQ